MTDQASMPEDNRDIVVRLRDDPGVKDVLEAADEIERLRSRRASMPVTEEETARAIFMGGSLCFQTNTNGFAECPPSRCHCRKTASIVHKFLRFSFSPTDDATAFKKLAARCRLAQTVKSDPGFHLTEADMHLIETALRFAAALSTASGLAEAVAAEREACAKIAEAWHPMLYAPERGGEHPRDAAFQAAKECIAKAIRTRTQPPATGWRTMEVMPQAETFVLLWFVDDSPSPEPIVRSGFWSIDDHDWFESEASSKSLTELYGAPTHWMPLPIPPATGEGTAKKPLVRSGEGDPASDPGLPVLSPGRK